jgi:hypothetical protein
MVAGILSRSAYQHVLLLVHKILPIELAHLEIGRQLDGVGRAGLLAESAKDAAGEIDAEESGVAPPMFIFGRLQGNTPDGTRHGTEAARNAPLLAIRIAAEDDASAPPRGEFGFLLGILHRNAPVEHVLKHNPHGS